MIVLLVPLNRSEYNLVLERYLIFLAASLVDFLHFGDHLAKLARLLLLLGVLTDKGGVVGLEIFVCGLLGGGRR